MIRRITADNPATQLFVWSRRKRGAAGIEIPR
jgi:hypothetical protein